MEVDSLMLDALSPAVDAGIGLGDYTTYDYYDSLRDENPDIGAIEYDPVDFDPPPDPPTVYTSIPEVIYTRRARCTGEIIDDGGSTVSSRGLCWDTSVNPTISDFHVACSTGVVFSGFITELAAGTTYHVRAWAYSYELEDYFYGEDRTFTTPINSKVKTSGNYYRLNGQTVIIH
jgi:hypothetical protein